MNDDLRLGLDCSICLAFGTVHRHPVAPLARTQCATCGDEAILPPPDSPVAPEPPPPPHGMRFNLLLAVLVGTALMWTLGLPRRVITVDAETGRVWETSEVSWGSIEPDDIDLRRAKFEMLALGPARELRRVRYEVRVELLMMLAVYGGLLTFAGILVTLPLLGRRQAWAAFDQKSDAHQRALEQHEQSLAAYEEALSVDTSTETRAKRASRETKKACPKAGLPMLNTVRC